MKRRKVRTAVLGLMALLMWSGSMAGGRDLSAWRYEYSDDFEYRRYR